jgi:hypothetical protein
MTMAGEPSHYEVALTEQLPPPVPRTARLAARLSHLPVELIEPIIEDLPLFRVLELLAAPTCGPSLAGAIESSPAWSWLFTGHVMRLKRTWNSLNRLSWLWCSTKYTCVPSLAHWRLRLSSAELQKPRTSHYGKLDDKTIIAEVVRTSLDDCLVLGLRRMLGCDLYNVRPSAGERLYIGFSIPQVRALYIFLPAALLSVIKGRSAAALEEALRVTALLQNAQDCMKEAERGNINFQLPMGDLSRQDLWTVETAHRFLPFLAQAYRLLKESYSAELLCLAELHSQFPGKLKSPFAPDTPPKDPEEVTKKLQRDAQRILTRPLRNSRKINMYSRVAFNKVESYRFRYPDTSLVPSNWCFVLYQVVQRRYPLSSHAAEYPDALLPLLAEVEDGLPMIYQRNPQERFNSLVERVDSAGMQNLQRLNAILRSHPDYGPFLHYVSGAPRPLRELSWLKSFLTCVEWMETEFRTLASACRLLGQCNSSVEVLDLGSNVLFPPADLSRFYGRFVDKAPPDVIARCMLGESIICEGGHSSGALLEPSELVLHLPEFSSHQGREIARYLLPSADDMGMDAQQLRYESVRDKIVRCLRQCRSPRVPWTGTNESVKRQMRELMGPASSAAVGARTTLMKSGMAQM